MKKKDAARWILQASDDELYFIDHAIEGASFQAGMLRNDPLVGCYYILVECEDGEIYAEHPAMAGSDWEDEALAELYSRIREEADDILNG